MQGLADGVFVECRDGIAVRFLVAGVEQSVERERVIFGSGDFFFDERAYHPGFGGGEVDVHGDR